MIPLFLERVVYVLYLEINDKGKLDADITVNTKRGIYRGTFYRVCEVRNDEMAMDMYPNNISGLVGFIGRGMDQIVKLMFINGFPKIVSVTL